MPIQKFKFSIKSDSVAIDFQGSSSNAADLASKFTESLQTILDMSAHWQSLDLQVIKAPEAEPVVIENLCEPLATAECEGCCGNCSNEDASANSYDLADKVAVLEQIVIDQSNQLQELTSSIDAKSQRVSDLESLTSSALMAIKACRQTMISNGIELASAGAVDRVIEQCEDALFGVGVEHSLS